MITDPKFGTSDNLFYSSVIARSAGILGLRARLAPSRARQTPARAIYWWVLFRINYIMPGYPALLGGTMFKVAVVAAWLLWFVGLFSCLLALVIASLAPTLGHDNQLAFRLPWGEMRTSIQASVIILGGIGLLLLGISSTLLVHRLPQSPQGSGLKHAALRTAPGSIPPVSPPPPSEKDPP